VRPPAEQDDGQIFLPLEGDMAIEFRDIGVTESCGEVLAVPAEAENRPIATEEHHPFLVELAGARPPGDGGGCSWLRPLSVHSDQIAEINVHSRTAQAKPRHRPLRRSPHYRRQGSDTIGQVAQTQVPPLGTGR
jgi:hypothetical protein